MTNPSKALSIFKKGGLKLLDEITDEGVDEVSKVTVRGVPLRRLPPGKAAEGEILEIRNLLTDTPFGNQNSSFNRIIDKAATEEEAVKEVEKKFAGIVGKGEVLDNLVEKTRKNFTTLKAAGLGTAVGGSLLLGGDTTKQQTGMPTGEGLPGGASILPKDMVEEVKVPVQEAVKEVLPAEEVPVKKPELKLPGMKPMAVPDLSHLDNTLNGLRKIRKEVDLVDPDGKLAVAQDDLETQMVMARAVFEEAQRNARTEEEQKMVSTQWKEVASMLGEALVNIGTGIVGLKTGKDLSGVQFKQKDWGAEYDRIRKGTENKIKDAIVLLNLDQEAITAKKKEIKDTLEAQRKTQEEVIAEEQRAFLTGQEGKTREEIARAEAANRANLENYQTEAQAATTRYREEMGAVEQEARRKHDLVVNAMNNQARLLAAEGRADSTEAKALENKRKDFNEALVALHAYMQSSGKNKLTYERSFRENAYSIGIEESKIQDILTKAGTDGFLNWFIRDQAEAIADFQKMNPAGQPKPTGDTIQGGQPTPSPAPKPAGRRQWTE